VPVLDWLVSPLDTEEDEDVLVLVLVLELPEAVLEVPLVPEVEPVVEVLLDAWSVACAA
jgi:hypothetical protein